jgi:hypothetical protein
MKLNVGKAIPLLAIVVLVSACALAQQVGTYEYKGLRIGMTREQALAALKPYHKQITSEENTGSGRPDLVASEYGGNIKTTVRFAKETDRVNGVTVQDKTDPFGVFTVKSRLKYGTPNRENSETKLEWERRVPAGCFGKKVPCHFETFAFEMDGGDSWMFLMGNF